ncbi:ricin B lectin domain-containing protein [Phellopilus nigrolimitatus]|nr:ricin B lectin domain-containing protein [Phellopilus nigrolimitatus]
MELEPGIYIMRNFRSNSVIDLSGADSKTIIGFPWHGHENQQWEFDRLGDGWYIRSVHTGGYLTIEKGMGNGFPVVANNYPVSWVVEHDETKPNDEVYRILWPNSSFGFDLDNGKPTPGTKINLWSKMSGAHHQLWRLQRCTDKEVATTNATKTTETGTTTTTTTVTTTTITTTTVSSN